MEKEKKAAAYGRGGGAGTGGGRGHSWGSSIGDKLKMAKKSSRKLSSYAKSKLGEGQESLIKRWRKSGSGSHYRDAHSDTEEETGTQTTPLLFSMSASTQNLSSSSLGPSSAYTSKAPPPKPPRTFKTKQLKDLIASEEDDDVSLSDSVSKEEDDFSMNVLTAIKEVGVAYSLDAGDVSVGNGCIPDVRNGNGNCIMRSESSPQLSVKTQNGNEDSETSPRLHTISEDNIDSFVVEDKTNNDRSNNSFLHHSSISCPSGPVSTPPALGLLQDNDRLVQSVPLRRKTLLMPLTSVDDSDVSLTYPSGTSGVCSTITTGGSDATSTTITGGSDVCSTTTTGSSDATTALDSSFNKRFSILSTTSAEYFSAESSEGSKSDSFSPSPELIVRTSSLPLSPLSQCGRDDVISSMSIDDESFNTPPSSPFLSSQTTYPDSFPTLRPGIVINMDRVSSASENSVLCIEERDGEVIVIVQEEGEEEKEKEEGEEEEEKEEGEEEEKEEGEDPLTPTQSTPQHAINNKPRHRSLTVSEFGTLPVRGRKSQKNRVSLTSKDDNFETEFREGVPDDCGRTYSDGMSSYFSQKDLEDIFTVGGTRKEVLSPPQIPTVKEGEEEEEEEEDEEELEASVNKEENSVEEVAELVENRDLEASLLPPEEAIVIPDAITPDMVRDHHHTLTPLHKCCVMGHHTQTPLQMW